MLEENGERLVSGQIAFKLEKAILTKGNGEHCGSWQKKLVYNKAT